MMSQPKARVHQICVTIQSTGCIKKKVNTLKNYSNFKSIRYLGNIIFLKDKSKMYLPPAPMQNHWCVTINSDSVAGFVSQAEMQLHQVNENQNRFEWIWGCDVILLGHDEYAWSQRSILGHVWPSEVTMNMHEVRGWNFLLEVKLTHDLMQTHCDLTGRR